jgi:phage terminase large subunit-like protein
MIAAQEHTLARRYEAAEADNVIQAKRLDFDSQASVPLEHFPSVKHGDEVVDVVSQEVNALLARLRGNSNEPGEEKR